MLKVVVLVSGGGTNLQAIIDAVSDGTITNTEIVGVINGDITSEELTVGNTRRLFNGTATVILRSTKQPGEVKLNIVADGLKDIKAMKMMSK